MRIDIEHAEPAAVTITAVRLVVEHDELQALEESLMEARMTGSCTAFVLSDDGVMPFTLDVAAD